LTTSSYITWSSTPILFCKARRKSACSNFCAAFIPCQCLISQSNNGEDHSNAHTCSSPQVHGLARFFPQPGILIHLAVKGLLRNARERCWFPLWAAQPRLSDDSIPDMDRSRIDGSRHAIPGPKQQERQTDRNEACQHLIGFLSGGVDLAPHAPAARRATTAWSG
jgi:hypothetical protein